MKKYDPNDDLSNQANPPACGSDCDCGKPSGNRHVKIAVTLLVALAVCGILVYKGYAAKKNDSAPAGSSFASPSSIGWGSTQTSKVLMGESLSSISDLNSVAANQDTVLVFVPAKDQATLQDETNAVVKVVRRKLEEKGVRIGLYTLSVTSPEYPNLAVQMPLPGMVVLTKDKSIGMASAPLSEDKLMQAYVSSTKKSAGCCPPGGGTSTKCP